VPHVDLSILFFGIQQSLTKNWVMFLKKIPWLVKEAQSYGKLGSGELQPKMPVPSLSTENT
jgi:hypothetical protein